MLSLNNAGLSAFAGEMARETSAGGWARVGSSSHPLRTARARCGRAQPLPVEGVTGNWTASNTGKHRVTERALHLPVVPATQPGPAVEPETVVDGDERDSRQAAGQDQTWLPQCVASAQQGDADAFDQLVDFYQQAISARMWRFTRDHHTHEELVQEVFVSAFRSLDGFRGDAPFEHWLNRIATRTGYRFWRKRDRTARQIPFDPEECARLQDGAEQPASAREAADLLHSVLARLPPRDRLILTLMYWEDCSVAEAATQTGWSQSMVKVQAHRARKKLKQLLEGVQR